VHFPVKLAIMVSDELDEGTASVFGGEHSSWIASAFHGSERGTGKGGASPIGLSSP
jgi:hypothetical protein